jgi:two-component system, chemotaxis family, response regulator Rcp1
MIESRLLPRQALVARSMASAGTPARILIVEDNDPDVFLVEEALRSQGIAAEIERAYDGEDALAALSKLAAPNLPDLIIIDLNLPKVTGIEVLKHARNLALLDHVPVLILTSSQSRADRAVSLQLGANAYIAKPPTLPEFLSAVGLGIGRLLQKSAGAAAPNSAWAYALNTAARRRVYWYCRPTPPCSKSTIFRRATATFARCKASRYAPRPVRRSGF